MLRGIVVTIGVSVMVLGVSGSAGAAPPPGHQEILDEVNTGNSQHSGLPRAWDKTLPANDPGGAACSANSSRFTCVMGGAAVRDNETGLVWEQSPATTIHKWTNTGGEVTFNARRECTSRTTGGRQGWRLPSVHELASLVDPNNPGGNPDLPPGHPFTDVQSDSYWSAAADAELPTVAWDVFFGGGDVSGHPKSSSFRVWCVRGGMNADQY